MWLRRLASSSTAAASTSTLPGLSIDRMLKKTRLAYPNCLCLIQIGDFYEMLGEDARRGSELLGITLTKRSRGKPKEQDMAGIPCKSLKTYLQRLTKQGEKVVVVDQIGNYTGTSPGNMQREVVRVVTPGTLCEDELLHAGEDNFLASIAMLPNNKLGENTLAVAYTDVSTMDGTTVQSFASHIEAEDALRRIAPKEILVVQAQHQQLSTALPWLFEGGSRREHVVSVVPSPVMTPSATGGGGSLSLMETQAVQCLKEYVGRTLMPKSFDWTAKRVDAEQASSSSSSSSMMIDSSTRLALELSRTNNVQGGRTLLQQVDYTCTAGGTRLLRSRLECPSMNLHEITRRLDSVDYFGEGEGEARYGQAQSLLRPLRDPGRALQRLVVGRWSVRDLQDVYNGLVCGERLAAGMKTAGLPQELEECVIVWAGGGGGETAVEVTPEGQEMLRVNWQRGKELGVFPSDQEPPPPLTSLSQLRQELQSALGAVDGAVEDEVEEDGNDNRDDDDEDADSLADRPRVLARRYNAKYDELHDEVNASTTLADLQRRLQLDYHAKIRIEHTSRAGHFIIVPKSVSAQFSLQPKLAAVFRPLRVGAHRFTTDELDMLNRRHKRADDDLAQCEQVLLARLCALTVCLRHCVSRAFHSLAVVDVAASTARAARELNLVRPELLPSSSSRPVLDLRECRHLVVEQANPNFVGNDLVLGGGEESSPLVYLITGPNMGGKSTYLRSCALVPVLAQSGLFVPCHSARVGLVDRLFARIGASDDLANNRSTFMVEMQETAHMLQNATSQSLVIVDELGRGTSPEEGLCLAQAVLEELVNVGCRALFATHFHALAKTGGTEGALAGPVEQTPGHIAPYTTEVVVVAADAQSGEQLHHHHHHEHKVIFTFKILPGVTKSSFGLSVAKLAGVPPTVLDRASFLLLRASSSSSSPI